MAARIHGHDAAVCGNHQRVGEDAEGDQPESGNPAIRDAEGQQQSVGHELHPLDLALAEDPHGTKRDELRAQSGIQDRPPPESQRSDARELSPQSPDQQNGRNQAGDERHAALTNSSCSVVPSVAINRPTRVCTSAGGSALPEVTTSIGWGSMT